MRPYLSTPKSITRIRISIAGLNERGVFVQPVAATGAAPGNGSLAGEARWMVELEAERGDEVRRIVRRDVVRRHAATGKEPAEVDRRALDRGRRAAGVLELHDLLAAPFGRLSDRLGLGHGGQEGAGAVGKRRAVDVERVVGRPVDARPGAGRQAVPAGTGVGRCLGEQATIRGRRSLLQEFGHRRHVAAASPAVRRELLDEILAQSVSDEQEDRSVVPVAPVVVAAVTAVRAGPGGGTDRRHGEHAGGAGEPDRDGQTTVKRSRAH